MEQFRIHPMILFIILMGLAGCVPTAIQSGNGNILLIDDFSTSINNWTVWENKAGSAVSYFREGLVFIVNVPQYDYISVPNGNFSDVKIETTVNKLIGSDENDFGIVCRYQDQRNFYGFIISSDGYFGIIKIKEGNYQLLNSNLEFSPGIHTGLEFNYLRADCIGSRLSFYANGIKLAEVLDPDLLSGKVGLMAGSFDQSGIVILFDNFLVSKP